MGQLAAKGNVTPAAEFNIWVDPEAARRVFMSCLKIEMVGWELSRSDAAMNDEEIERILAMNTALSDFTVNCNSRTREAYLKQTGERKVSLPDRGCDGSYCCQPESYAHDPQMHYVEIETASELTRRNDGSGQARRQQRLKKQPRSGMA